MNTPLRVMTREPRASLPRLFWNIRRPETELRDLFNIVNPLHFALFAPVEWTEWRASFGHSRRERKALTSRALGKHGVRVERGLQSLSMTNKGREPRPTV